MARLPRLFRTRSIVPRKKSHSCRFGIIQDGFIFYYDNGILFVFIRIASKISLFEKHLVLDGHNSKSLSRAYHTWFMTDTKTNLVLL